MKVSKSARQDKLISEFEPELIDLCTPLVPVKDDAWSIGAQSDIFVGGKEMCDRFRRFIYIIFFFSIFK